MKKRTAIYLLVFLLLLLLLVIAGQRFNQPVVAPVEGAKAPPISGRTVEGTDISLSDFNGRRVIITFWQTQSPPSLRELENLTALKRANGDKLGIITINEKGQQADIYSFVKNKKLLTPVVLDDAKYSLANLYKVDYMPTTFILDRHGIIVKKANGGMTAAEMLEYLK
ncbi:MAG TPA: TlpA disulfide reductase family protein [Bacillota bacterium]|nr:TlpA disulfide reductase family protein [Bacillota bacterium]